ncbi:RICIN domain-containing protein [Streptomyces klenkii]|uniref:RICIN domain-containing protein n=1 Tax=Streptomyces klenkii TaxID=1420899 RepID=UPI003438E9D6
MSVRTDKDAKDGDYFLTNVKNGRRLHVAAHSHQPSASAEVWNGDSADALRSSSWRFTEEKGAYALTNSASEYWLNVRRFSTEAGATIEQWLKPPALEFTAEKRDFQLWYFEPVGARESGPSAEPQKDTAAEETRAARCGGRFDSYIGTYKGTYKSEPAMVAEGISVARAAAASRGGKWGEGLGGDAR